MVAICDTFVGKLRAHCYAGAMTVMRSLQPIASGAISHLPSDLPPQILEYAYGKEATKHISMLMQQHTEIKKQQLKKEEQ